MPTGNHNSKVFHHHMTKIGTLEDAVSIAAIAHRGQKDKAGAPYLLHPLRMMLRMSSEDAMMAAVLHDVVEDTDWTLEQLHERGFSDEVLEAVKCLTHNEGESYEEFIERVGRNHLAEEVKIADLEDNMNIQRISHNLEAAEERNIQTNREHSAPPELKHLLASVATWNSFTEGDVPLVRRQSSLPFAIRYLSTASVGPCLRHQ